MTHNEIYAFVQSGIRLEEAIFTYIGDGKSANYKTLVRRISQNLRTKDEFK